MRVAVVTRTSALLEKGVKVTERFHFQARQTKPQTTSGLSHGPLRAPLTSSSQIKLTNSLRKKSRVRATTSSSSEQIGRLSRLKTLLLPEKERSKLSPVSDRSKRLKPHSRPWSTALMVCFSPLAIYRKSLTLWILRANQSRYCILCPPL